jgi:hypothetical protein
MSFSSYRLSMLETQRKDDIDPLEVVVEVQEEESISSWNIIVQLYT